MRRRILLESVGTVAVAGLLAGCSGDGGGGDGGSGGDEGGGANGTATATATETATATATETATATATETATEAGICTPPSTEDLESLLPEDGAGFTMYQGPSEPYMRNLEEKALQAGYSVDSGDTYFFGVGLFESNSKAQEMGGYYSQDNQDGDIGYVIVDNWIFYGVGDDRDGIKQLLARSPALSESCVNDTIEFPP